MSTRLALDDSTVSILPWNIAMDDDIEGWD